MSITRVWIAGAGGRLGSALYHRFSGNTDYKLVTSDRDVPIEDAREAGRFADLNHPDVIINCAGLTDVRACEEKPEEAYKINAIGARNLAVAARRIDAKLIQISTDDVFDGDDDAALCEFDDAHPTTMYGKSKYAGEKLVRELTDKHVIVRSSWLYGVGSYDFVDRVLDNAKKDGKVVLPEDEISSPTSADALAGFIECLMHTREFGLYHASCDGSCSRAEWAREILRLNGMDSIPVSFAETILNIIPKNPIGALANGEMLQVIVFALIIGIILAKLQDKTQLVTNFFQQGNDIMMEMTMMVMRLAPIGVFCLIAKTFAGLGFSAMVPMFKYMGAVLLALFIQCCGVYQVLLALFTRLNPLRFLKKFAPVMGFAFSTATSNATIPMNIDTLEEKIGVNRRISSFTIPLGATINMDGTSIMQGVAVVFVAQAFGITLTPADYLTVIATATLASIGTAGVPSVGLITLAMVFDSVGLPVAGIGLIMGIDRILDMARTAVNITGDAVCTTIVAHQDGALDKSVFNKN